MPASWIKKIDLTSEALSSQAKQLGVNGFYAQLLLARGITTKEQASIFFNPQIGDLHDPFLMKDMDLATIRIDQALNNDEKVWVYGDYDVDGTTSVALMYSFLRQFVADIDYYIPDREKEGYGLSEQAVDLAIEKKVNLIITLDCGIRSVDLVEKAKQAGIDFIICDHHEVGDTLPNGVAVLDAKRPDCTYPFKELSACGVGFKLTQALCTKWELPIAMAFDSLDLVAVSIASDLVPITGENRVLAFHGLIKLDQNPTKGLKMIMDKFMTQREIDITNIVFMIGPRINAAGRLASAKTAVKLLLAENDVQADELAEKLNELNVTRRALDQTITDEALDILRKDKHYAEKKTTVVYNASWHKGVVGIVASRLLEHHYKPTIVLTQSGDKIVGSARSIEDYNIHDAILNCKAHLLQFGGHKYAAGLTLKPEQLEGFKKAFEKEAIELTQDQLTRKLYYEAELNLKSVSESLYLKLKRFAPFGPDNMKPVFVSTMVWDTGNARTMGKGGTHLKLNLVSSPTDKAIGATAFGFGHLYPELKNGRRFDVMYTIEENSFRGNSTIEIMVIDIRLK
ncbi:MAG: single-stranded-DNA-specific exonuclease [Bacteroidia bacterium]|jgi:single-stranded-DNA-specific exonuclease